MTKNLYSVLGVTKTATNEEIKKAFRDLAKKHHPDINKNENSERTFKEINEAYQILADEEKRLSYDQISGFSSGGRPYYDAFNIFGGIKYKPNLDIQAKIEITIKDLFNGFTGRLKYNRKVYKDRTYSQEECIQEFEIKKGSQNKDLQKIFNGRGNVDVSGSGQLRVVVKVNDAPPFFTRKINDIYTQMPLPLYMLFTEESVKVATLHGDKTIELKDILKSKDFIVVLVGCGLLKTIGGSTYGDHYVQFKIELPNEASEEEKFFYKNYKPKLENYPQYKTFTQNKE